MWWQVPQDSRAHTGVAWGGDRGPDSGLRTKDLLLTVLSEQLACAWWSPQLHPLGPVGGGGDSYKAGTKRWGVTTSC